jgi:hypothetical protein
MKMLLLVVLMSLGAVSAQYHALPVLGCVACQCASWLASY